MHCLSEQSLSSVTFPFSQKYVLGMVQSLVMDSYSQSLALRPFVMCAADSGLRRSHACIHRLLPLKQTLLLPDKSLIAS